MNCAGRRRAACWDRSSLLDVPLHPEPLVCTGLLLGASPALYSAILGAGWFLRYVCSNDLLSPSLAIT